MSEQVDMGEIETKPNESSKLYLVLKISNISRKDKVASEIKNHT